MLAESQETGARRMRKGGLREKGACHILQRAFHTLPNGFEISTRQLPSAPSASDQVIEIARKQKASVFFIK